MISTKSNVKKTNPIKANLTQFKANLTQFQTQLTQNFSRKSPLPPSILIPPPSSACRVLTLYQTKTCLQFRPSTHLQDPFQLLDTSNFSDFGNIFGILQKKSLIAGRGHDIIRFLVCPKGSMKRRGDVMKAVSVHFFPSKSP